MIEEFQVAVDTVSDLKALVQLREELTKLQRQGINVKSVIKDMDTKMKSSGINVKAATRAFTPFRMELLSVMFGAQMVAGALWGLLNPALTAVGIFELFSSVLEVLFLPIALLLLDWLLPIMEAFMDLDESTQLIIGSFVVLLGIVASAVALFGSLGLFLAGLGTTFGIGAAAIAGFVAIVAVVAAVIGGLIYLWTHWNEISSETKWLIAGIGLVIASLLIFVSPLAAAIVGIGVAIMGVIAIIKNWSVISEWLMGVWTPIADWFTKWVIDPIKNAWQSLVDGIKSAWESIKGIWEKVTTPVKNVWSGIKGVFGGRQMGGYIPHSGLYKMHAGETVTSNYENNFSPTVNVNASSNVDIEMLKRQLNQQWSAEFGRLSRA